MIDHSSMALGKKLGVVHDRRTLMARDYVTLPKVPSRHHVAEFDDWGMYRNDGLGDCLIADFAHHDMALDRGTRNRERPVTNDDVVAMYSRVGGYVPGDPSTDNGCYMLDGMNDWRTNGLAGEKITAFVAIDPKDIQMMKTCIWLFGGVDLGFALPLTAQRQEVWDVVQDSGSAAAPGSWGGHAVYGVGYWAKGGVDVVTWARRKRVTDAFIRAYCDEAYAVVSPDWIKPSGRTPRNVDVDSLMADLKVVTRQV